jgi:adenosylhomocysteine nucleosidase
MTQDKPRIGGPVGDLAEAPVDWLVFFAVKEEAKFFSPSPGRRVQTWLTGMGRRHAVENLRYAVGLLNPRRVLTCGFAGGLNPRHDAGTVLFDADFDAGVSGALQQAGAHPGKFHCATRVAVTASEKQKLWAETGADAVEMESAVIRELCRQKQIPSATVRVISDAADEDLVLDFNALMTVDQRISYLKLVRALLRSPKSIPRLIAFQRQVMASARELARVLNSSLRTVGGCGR